MRVLSNDHHCYSRSKVDDLKIRTVRPPAAFVASRLIETINHLQRPICYIALDEAAAENIAKAVTCLSSDIDVIVFPPWDCLPYDRVPPSRHCMGRRMDALRAWAQTWDRPRLMVTSLDAALQRVPAREVVKASRFELIVGEHFDRDAFGEFTVRCGYIQEGVADDPGELAMREEVIDIFPAGASIPMRIALQDERVVELRSYDPESQRTEKLLEKVIIGPASEAIRADGRDFDDGGQPDTMERRLFRAYGPMTTLFDHLEDCRFGFSAGNDERVEEYLEVIDDARQADQRFRLSADQKEQSLYLSSGEWMKRLHDLAIVDLDLAGATALPAWKQDSDPKTTFADFAREILRSSRKLVVAGTGDCFRTWCRRLERQLGTSFVSAKNWEDVRGARPGTPLMLCGDLQQGFSNLDVVVVAAGDVLGNTSQNRYESVDLDEPELRIGDVVVHEDHGVGLLKDLESIVVEGSRRDAARLEYRDGASILVPMEDFGKLWRYGSEPGAVTLDRLHTDAWDKKRAKIAKDIRATARHLLDLARERQSTKCEAINPPQAQYRAFARRFPYPETADQSDAIGNIIKDLGSGHVMNRLVCGDVGFGKTEVALRAAAVVALAGGQVVVMAPTTVLARQHYSVFQRRFAGTGIEVAMLSRLVKPRETKRVKAQLASGQIGIVIATQAVLARNVAFSNLSLLIIDEEHRFGLKQKRAMNALAPSLHMLTMSATPIPRTFQSLLIGLQDVSLLNTPPSKRRPVRTSLSAMDHASMRVALMREHRRGGQSFVVVARIEDIASTAAVLAAIVPELSLTIAHGKMRAGEIDNAMVSFAEGQYDVLLSTDIIENGLDIPRANTIFIVDADRFGLAQLHQLRGRVGRGRVQGIAYLITRDEAALSEETRLRLSAVVENDRLGSGVAISMRDLDVRGGGDLAGDAQAGHLNVVGVALYQKLLERAIAAVRRQVVGKSAPAAINLGLTGAIPEHYVTDGTVRLNLYAKLTRARSPTEVDQLKEEFLDRFGDPPDDALTLLRITKLQIVAGRTGIAKLDAGDRAVALTITAKTAAKVIKRLLSKGQGLRRDNRLVFQKPIDNGSERLQFLEWLFAD